MRTSPVLEGRSAVQAKTGDAKHGELDREDIALAAGRGVARCAMYGVHRAVRKGLGVERRRIVRGIVVPEAYRVLAGHLDSPELGWVVDLQRFRKAGLAVMGRYFRMGRP